MVIIMNRETLEYDNKGTSNTFHKVRRHCWNTLGHAKNHVAINMSKFTVDWYKNADFIEIDANDVTKITPVIDYLRESNPYIVRKLLGLEEFK